MSRIALGEEKAQVTGVLGEHVWNVLPSNLLEEKKLDLEKKEEFDQMNEIDSELLVMLCIAKRLLKNQKKKSLVA